MKAESNHFFNYNFNATVSWWKYSNYNTKICAGIFEFKKDILFLTLSDREILWSLIFDQKRVERSWCWSLSATPWRSGRAAIRPEDYCCRTRWRRTVSIKLVGTFYALLMTGVELGDSNVRNNWSVHFATADSLKILVASICRNMISWLSLLYILLAWCTISGHGSTWGICDRLGYVVSGWWTV